MNQYKTSSTLKNTAKNLLDGKYVLSILVPFLASLIVSGAAFVIDIVASTTMNSVYYSTQSPAAYNGVSFVFDLILLGVNIILGVMNAGVALFFLNASCGQPYSVNDLFYAFKNDSKKALGISAAVILVQAICLWPSRYLLQSYLNTQESRTLLYMIITLVVGLCIYIPVSLGISLSFYLMFDFPQYSAKETLALSWKLMNGHRLRLFLLQLSFLPLMLLCLCSFGIGFLWLEPYMQMTYVQFFLDLMNPGTNK